MAQTENSSGRYHVLVVEDEPVTRQLLTALLSAEFTVSTAVGVTEARARLDEARARMVNGQFLIILLDLNLPDGDGLALAHELGNRPDIGMIMVTSRTDDTDRIIGLAVGADDYIAKPFNSNELMARVRALARRLNGARPIDAAVESVVRFDGWTLDRAGRSLRDAAGREIYVTRAEFNLLEALASRIGRVLSRDQLLNMVSGRDSDSYDRTIDVLVGRVRRKIESDPKLPRLIVTVPGVGYKFTPSTSG